MATDTLNKNTHKFRWAVTHEHPINTDAKQLWSLISKPGNLATCHPFCCDNPVQTWPGIGSQDSVCYYSGLILHRKFTQWIDGVGYDLEIGKSQGKQSFVSWRITQLGDEKSKLSITIKPHDLQHLPIIKRGFRHYTYLRPMLKGYLRSVLLGFDWYITTGIPVKHNQFGSHQWFSPDQS